ncbi:hypothetical protein [Pontibacter oryzae]|uniref:hypothetical protein n=1 Tax=Pontibacter oryzae TaxID=2304593 RepID=UPI0011C3650D|nr:hypothetical protein [Pontibacter oryzae]
MIILFVVSGVLYFLFYPFLKNRVNRKKTLRWFLIVYGAALLFSTISYYFSEEKPPESFLQGVELVKQQPQLTSKIGQFKQVVYNNEDLPRPSDNPAILKFTLQGTSGAVQVEAKVAKGSRGGWYLTETAEVSPLYN